MNETTATPTAASPSPTDSAAPTREDLERALTAYGAACEADGWLSATHGDSEDTVPRELEAVAEQSRLRRYNAFRAAMSLVDALTSSTSMTASPTAAPAPASAVQLPPTPEVEQQPSVHAPLHGGVQLLPPCPPWCCAGEEHELDDLQPSGSTMHRALADRLALAIDGPTPVDVDVELSQHESLSWNERRLEREAAHVVLIETVSRHTILGGISRDHARRLADALQSAVDALDGHWLPSTRQEQLAGMANRA